ncbi:MAG: glycosyltransferase [Deltaproteobacteria bacterium]|nr:glycosyltransferase [Deltaproteobacteria bacterium]
MLLALHGDPMLAAGNGSAGGLNVYVKEVGLALGALGFEVDMFTRLSDPSQPRIEPLNAQVRTIRLAAGPMAHVGSDDLMPFSDEWADAVVRYAEENNYRYHVIHTNYWNSAYVGLRIRKSIQAPLTHTYHALGRVKFRVTGNAPPSGSDRLRVEREILEQADCIIATSPQEESELRQLYSGLGSIRVIPCGVDIRSFFPADRAECRERLDLPAEAKILLYVGRFDRRKGVDTLVRATALLKPRYSCVRTLIVGGGCQRQADIDYRAELQLLAQELGVVEEICLSGVIDHDRLAPYYSAADVCVVPSHYEPFGLIALESMACGTPVVGSRVGGLQSIVLDDQTGFTFEPRRADQLADAAGRVCDDPLLQRRLGNNGRELTVERYTWSAVARQLASFYDDLQGSSHPGSGRTELQPRGGLS